MSYGAVEGFLARVQKVRQLGPSRWICCCPAHEDKNPSMNVREMPDGKVLVVCRAGCTNPEIIASLGLHWSALFPQPDNTYAEYRREAKRFPASDVLAALEQEALIVAVAAANIKAGVQLSDADLDRVWLAHKRIRAALEMSNG